MGKTRRGKSWGAKVIIRNAEEALSTLVIEETTSSTPKAKKVEKRRALKFTPRRKKILRVFLRELIGEPRKYGGIKANDWIDELVPRFGEPKGLTCLVTLFDVQHWLKTEEFADLYRRVQEAESRCSSSSSFEPQTPESSRNSKTPPSFLSSPGSSVEFLEEVNQGNPSTSDDSQQSGGPPPGAFNSESSPIPGPSGARPMPKLLQQTKTSKENGQVGTSQGPKETPHPGPEVTILSNGIFIQVPPMSSRTSFFFLPTSWTVTALQESTDPRNPTLSSHALVREDFGFDPDTLQGCVRNATEAEGPTLPDNNYFYPDQESPQVLGGDVLLPSGSNDNIENTTPSWIVGSEAEQ